MSDIEHGVPVDVLTGPVDIESLRIARQKMLELEKVLRDQWDAVHLLLQIRRYVSDAVGEATWREAQLLP